MKITKIETHAPDEVRAQFLTRLETAEFLRISLPTLNSYSKAGILRRYYLGNRVLYKASEVMCAPKQVTKMAFKSKGGKI